MIPLVSSLRATLKNSKYLFLSSGEETVNLGYSVFPFIGNNLSSLVLRNFDGSLGAFSNVDEKISLIDPINQRVVNQISGLENPDDPSLYFPPKEEVLFRGQGGIDSDGLFTLSRNNDLITLNNIGSNVIQSVDGLFYAPLTRSAFVLDSERNQIHRYNQEGVLETNFLSFPNSTSNLSDYSYDKENDILYLADATNNLIQYIKGLQSPIIGSYDLGAVSPTGVCWSPSEQVLYVSGLVSSQFKVLAWQNNSLVDITLSSPDFVGTILKLDYNPFRDQIYSLTLDPTLGEGSFSYLSQHLGEITLEGNLYLPYDGSVDIVNDSDRASFYVWVGDNLREYQNLHALDFQKTIGTEANILDTLPFENQEGIIAVSGLTATVYNSRLQIRTVNFNLYEAYSIHIEANDSVIQTFPLSLESGNFFLFSFSSGKVLAVDSGFNVSSILPIENISITVEGTDVLINPSETEPYRVVDFIYSQSFNYLYICVENGKTENSTARRGVVIVYDLSNGISNPNPIAFTEASSSFNAYRSITLNSISNHFFILGESSDNGILQVYDLNPEGGTFSLLASKTSGSLVSNLVTFNNRVFFVSNETEILYSLGTALLSALEETSIEGEISLLNPSSSYGFLYLLDKRNNRVISINESIEVYTDFYSSNTVKSLVTFRDGVFISQNQEEIIFPSLKDPLQGGQFYNEIKLANPISVPINVGDVITLSLESEVIFLVSLSTSPVGSNRFFVETFSPNSTMTVEGTTIAYQGDSLVKFKQTPLSVSSRLESTQISSEFILNSYDQVYSVKRDPHLLTNVNQEPRLNTLLGNFELLGDRLDSELRSPYLYRDPDLYVLSQSDSFYKIQLTYRWVRKINLINAPNLRDLSSFEIVGDSLYALFFSNSFLYEFSLQSENSSSLSYEIMSQLDLETTQFEFIFYNKLERQLNLSSPTTTLKVKL